MSLIMLRSKTHSKKADKIPAGFKTAHAWAALEGLSDSHTRRILQELRKSNPPAVECKSFRIMIGGILIKVNHYKKLS